MDAVSLVGPTRSPAALIPGTLTLHVCAGGDLYYVIDSRIADIPRDPPGSRHSSESLITALEDRVFRKVCYVNNVHLCGPAPRMTFGPVDPALASVAPAVRHRPVLAPGSTIWGPTDLLIRLAGGLGPFRSYPGVGPLGPTP